MPEPSNPTCEVKIDGAWQAVALTEAHARHGQVEKRCPSCHGKVTVAGTYNAQVKLSLTHRKRHDGCPLMTRGYTGTPRMHPQALA